MSQAGLGNEVQGQRNWEDFQGVATTPQLLAVMWSSIKMVHTGILLDQTLKERALSNFALQHC